MQHIDVLHANEPALSVCNNAKEAKEACPKQGMVMPSRMMFPFPPKGENAFDGFDAEDEGEEKRSGYYIACAEDIQIVALLCVLVWLVALLCFALLCSALLCFALRNPSAHAINGCRLQSTL